MYLIEKTHEFSSAHRLDGLPEGHKCGSMHGHNYVVKVSISTPDLDHNGFVLDFSDLSPLFKLIDELLDHKVINDIVDFNPTSENLCKWLYDLTRDNLVVPANCSIRVSLSETQRTWATYYE